MIEVSVPREIKDFKEKIVAGMTMRQLVCFGLAVVSAVGSYLFTYKHIGVDSASWLCMFVASPFVAMAIFKKNGLTFEQFVMIIIRFLFLVPQKRPYKTDNFFEKMEKGAVEMNNKGMMGKKKKGGRSKWQKESKR